MLASKRDPNLTRENIPQFRAALRLLLDEGPLLTNYGVCRNICAATGVRDCWYDGYAFVNEYANTWEHCERYEDGDVHDYCVPHVGGVPKWEGPNWEMRKSLMEHLLKELDRAEANLFAVLAD